MRQRVTVWELTNDHRSRRPPSYRAGLCVRVYRACGDAMKFTFDTTIERGDDELELRVTYELNPTIPATHLQPAEGGDCEILEAKFVGVDAASLPAPLSEAEWDALLIECEERAQDDATDAAEDYADWKYSQAEDRRMMDKYEGQIA